MAKRLYKLSVPANARCFVEGCQNPVMHILNVRIRKTDTGAIYGPNIDNAWLCGIHGMGGCDLTIEFKPRRDGMVFTTLTSEGREVARMARPVTGGHPEQGDLF